MDLKETDDNNVTSAIPQVKPEKYRNKELIDGKEKERKETRDLKDTKNVSPVIPHRKLLTDKTQELVSRQSLISKIEENNSDY